MNKYFGQLQGKYFYPPWDVKDVLDSVEQMENPDSTLRVSEFPIGISCHSRSFALSDDDKSQDVLGLLSGLDKNAVLNVFPQQDDSLICFRLVVSGEDWLIEAGKGQAMYVFEEQRGHHHTEIFKGSFQIELQLDFDDQGNDIRVAVKELLQYHFLYLTHSLTWMSFELGLQTYAIEGYYDSTKNALPIIVDIDLPLDIAWN